MSERLGADSREVGVDPALDGAYLAAAFAEAHRGWRRTPTAEQTDHDRLPVLTFVESGFERDTR